MLRQYCSQKDIVVVILFFSVLHAADRKLEEKKLKCKQAIDTAEKIKKENILIKNEVIIIIVKVYIAYDLYTCCEKKAWKKISGFLFATAYVVDITAMVFHILHFCKSFTRSSNMWYFIYSS